MPKKSRKKKTFIEQPEPQARSSRFQFFLWICAFFFLAALLMRLDVITAWPGAESYSLDHALSNARGDSMLSFLYGLLFPLGENIDSQSQAIWLFPRLISVIALIATAVFTFRWAGKLFGKEAIGMGLLCAGASLYLPFFGKVATPDALALLGQAGFFWLILLAGADREKNYLLPAGIFLLLGGIAAPLSTLVFGLGTILAGRLLMGGGKQWMNLLFLLAIPLVILLLQGNQGIRAYWFWGGQPLAYGKFIAYSLLGMLPLMGWLMAGLRDVVYKVWRGEQSSKLLLSGMGIGLLTQSLVLPLLLAVVAGKQMQLYFRENNYPWKDWVRGGAVLHLVLAFLAAFFALSGAGLTFAGAGFRAALGMAAAYWIFSLLGVIGLYGDKRDFSLGGSILSGMLGVLFFWVQVYPYFETGRNWPDRLSQQVELKLPTYIPDHKDYSPALPYFRKAGIPLVQDSAKADLYLTSWPMTDTLSSAGIEISGRIILEQRTFGLKTE
ncbi:ArnT family glycosyltransferase [Neolewinella agarilytica]|uniref:ArnT family glycosyltransferase n=1 Tax=Neolewinella agarilytica TaxID=478744 RepID=UPI0023536F03|nr:hypothetical protein [Neolewinella agarilytica]